ncbi:MAG: DUF2460 domain-containing protein [Rickettsiaceae bacterium]|nr:DUF2460 domain-containing protein [Rickettsiaceae bacterium]
MTNYHNVRLPDYIALCAKGGPHFFTKIATTNSAREVRLCERDFAIHKYIVKNCLLDSKKFQELNSFFRARYGMKYSFRFKDFSDFKVNNQLLECEKDSNTTYALIKAYGCPEFSYIRKINNAIESSIKIFIDTKPLESSNWLYKNGRILLNNPLSAEQTLTASFEYDVNVRFCHDYFDYKYNNDGSVLVDNLEITEVCDE